MELKGKFSTILANNGIGDWPIQGKTTNVKQYIEKHGYTISEVLYDGRSAGDSIRIFIDHQGVQFV